MYEYEYNALKKSTVIRIFQRNRIRSRIGCLYIHIGEIYKKKLAHMIMESSKSKICRVGQQAGDPEEQMFRVSPKAVQQKPIWQMKSKCYLLENFLLLAESLSFLFYLGLQLLDKAHNTMERNLFYSKSTDLKFNLIQNEAATLSGAKKI